jgi:hypothetical protein
MMIRLVLWVLFVFALPNPSFASGNSCSFEVNDGIVLDLLETATPVQVGSHEILVPEGLSNLEFKVSNGRGQFAFRAGGKIHRPEPELGSTDRQNWFGLRSMIFTDDVEVGGETEVFTVSRDCFLGDIHVLYIVMKGLSVNPDESNIVLLRFEDSASVLIFGEGLNDYLEALRRANLSESLE